MFFGSNKFLFVVFRGLEIAFPLEEHPARRSFRFPKYAAKKLTESPGQGASVSFRAPHNQKKGGL